jgi:hypothetical protein
MMRFVRKSPPLIFVASAVELKYLAEIDMSEESDQIGFFAKYLTASVVPPAFRLNLQSKFW